MCSKVHRGVHQPYFEDQRVRGFRFQVSGCRAQFFRPGLGFRYQGARPKVLGWVSGIRVQGRRLGFRYQGAGPSVLGQC